MAEFNFDILKPQPTAGASFVSGMMEGQQDARAARTQDLQNQVSQMSLQKLQRDQENIDQIVATAHAHGGPKNSRAVAEAFLNSNNPEHWALGTKILQHEDAKDAYAKYNAAENGVSPAAPATPNTLATAVAPDVSATTPNTLATAVAPNNAAEPAVTTAIPSVAPPVETPLAVPNAKVNNLPATPAAPNVNALTKEQQIKALTVKLNTLAAMQSELPQVKPQIDLLKAQIINLQKSPVYHNVPGVGLVNPEKPNDVVVASKPMPTALANLIAERDAIANVNPNDPRLVNYDYNISKEQNLEKGRQAQLKVSQGNLNVNQAGLNLRRSEADPFGINGGGGGVSMGAPAAPAVAAAAAPVLTVANAFKQNLHGDEFLAALPPAVRNEVNAIVTGNTPPPNQNSKRGQQLMQLVTQADPSFDATAYGTKFAGEKSFLAKQGPAVKSFNVLVSHFDTLDKAAKALNNGDVKAFNSIGNTIAAQTGSTAPTDFAGVKKIVGDEIIKAIQGGAGALGDRKAIEDALSAANSPAQLASLINRFKELAGGQLGGLAQQYKSATGKTNFEDRFLMPEARKVFKTGSAAVGGGVDTSNPLLK